MSEKRDLSGRCGTCAFFIPRAVDASGAASGECRLGCWPAPLRDSSTCASHQPLGVRPKQSAEPKRARAKTVAQPLAERPALPKEVGIDMDQEEFRNVLREILLDELGVRDVELGDRWQHGEVVLVPGKAGVQEKRIPIDSLFRKVVLIREKLRVLEQRINNHEKLDDNDRLQLQQYITQCYGSLTTFNALFRNKEDQFAGQSGREE
ncbi:MAG TPA: hypothetical protein VG963_03525 [Polyangiaceae bacterium]|nr:hypothetical protein [Polyangiaceae bacterium]